jgi:hypothetical protein
MDIEAYELFLLSKLSDARSVDAALRTLKARPGAIAEAARQMESLGFGDAVHPADLYITTLGQPLSVTTLTDIPKTSRFVDSRLLRFHLPLWPDLDFRVKVDTAGHAWDMGFFRSPANPAMPPLRDASDLRSWRFVSEDVTQIFGVPRREDAWTGWETLWYTISDGHGVRNRRYLLAFDLNLYQSILLVE